jgi:hypothetical protein
MTPLTNAKHEAVALAYLADPEKVGWRAYRKVYPKSSRTAAEVAFSRLLRNAKFSARIAELAEQAAQGAVMTAQEALVELTKIARANMQDYMRVGPDGPVLDYSKLTRDQAAALQEVTVDTYWKRQLAFNLSKYERYERRRRIWGAKVAKQFIEAGTPLPEFEPWWIPGGPMLPLLVAIPMIYLAIINPNPHWLLQPLLLIGSVVSLGISAYDQRRMAFLLSCLKEFLQAMGGEAMEPSI